MSRAKPVRSMQREEALVEVLEATRREYASLRTLVARRRDALRRADLDQLDDALRQEQAALSRIGELDRSRTEAAANLALALELRGETSISELAARLGEPAGNRLTASAAALRGEVEACRRESSVVRSAAEALAQHVAGVLQTVNGVFAATTTYGRGGKIAVAVPLRTMDLRS